MMIGEQRYLVLTSELHTRGGIQRYTRHLIRSLMDISGAEAVRTVSLLPAVVPLREGNVPLPGLRDKLSFSLRSLIEAIRWRPHCLICNHIGLVPVARTVKAMWRVPYLVLTHGDDVWRPVPRYRFDQAAAVVSVSHFTARVLRHRWGVTPEKIWIIPGALDPDLIASPTTSAEVIARHRLAGKRVLLTVSRLDRQSRYKGHERVFRALRQIRHQLPPCAYLVVGEGNDRPYLESLARELELEDIVIFTGAVEDIALPAYYRACDVFIMPSLTDCDRIIGEGFGIAYIEAAAFGKPSIAGRGGGATEAVLDGITGILVDPQSVDEIAKAIVTLLTNDELRRRLGTQSQSRAWNEFSFDRFRTRVADLLKSLAGLREEA